MMSKIFKILLIAIIVTFSQTGCKKNNDPIRVVYKVSYKSNDSCKVLVRYKDVTDYVTLYINENWSKEIYLPPNTVASLVAIPQRDLSKELEESFYTLEINKKQRPAISIEIIRDWCTMSEIGENAISLSVITSRTCEEEGI
ncbi:MAG: hypothetical protein LBV43_09610 [Prevotella sp.]|jgi:hypothetical protein|nr:hypothetical protein [Prevotella sp.]